VGVSLGSLALDYVSHRQRAREITRDTANKQRDILARFCRGYGRRPVGRLGSADIERWMEAIAELSAGTRRVHWSVLRGFCRWLTQHHHVRRDPMASVPSPRVPRSVYRSLAPSDAGALLRACTCPRDRLIVTLGLQLGLRRAEIAALEVGDVSFSGESVEVRGKGGHHDRLPLTADAMAAIAAYVAERGITAGALIRCDRYPHRGVSPDWIGARVTQLAWDAGIKARAGDGVSTHALRHTAATDVYATSRDVLAVRDLLRHSNLQTTSIYVRGLDIEGLRAVIEGRHYEQRPEKPHKGDQ